MYRIMQKTNVVCLELKCISKLVSCLRLKGCVRGGHCRNHCLQLWLLFGGWWDLDPAVLHPEPISQVQTDSNVTAWRERTVQRTAFFPCINVIVIAKLLVFLLLENGTFEKESNTGKKNSSVHRQCFRFGGLGVACHLEVSSAQSVVSGK